jgi:hypothetical protein
MPSMVTHYANTLLHSTSERAPKQSQLLDPTSETFSDTWLSAILLLVF